MKYILFVTPSQSSLFCHMQININILLTNEKRIKDFKNQQGFLMWYCFFLVSLENVQIDVQDLTRGLENAKKELSIRQTMKVFCLKS